MIKYYLFLFSTIAMSSLFSANLNKEKCLKNTIQEAIEYRQAIQDCNINFEDMTKKVNSIDKAFYKEYENITPENYKTLSKREKNKLTCMAYIEIDVLAEEYKKVFLKLNEKYKNLSNDISLTEDERRQFDKIKNIATEMESKRWYPKELNSNIKLTDFEKYTLTIQINSSFKTNMKQMTTFNQIINEKPKSRWPSIAYDNVVKTLSFVSSNTCNAASYAYNTLPSKETLSSISSSTYNVASFAYNMMPELPSKETVYENLLSIPSSTYNTASFAYNMIPKFPVYEAITQQLPILTLPFHHQRSNPIDIQPIEKTDHILNENVKSESLENDIINISFTRSLTSTPTNESSIAVENTELTITSFDPE